MADYSKKRFLVVDDQPMAREGLRVVAQNLGAFVVEFASGYQDAIYRIRNNSPDIVLCDYVLGDGRSGQQLLEELRRFDLLSDESIFMMVTGEQSYEQVVAAVELVPDDYIIKPFSPEKLMLRLDRVVAKKLFFADYYRERRAQEYAAALTILQQKAHSEAGRPYRFEVLRQQAETLLAAGDASGAEDAYRGILENYEFPWARAGVARALHHQNRHKEAREEIERVVAGRPSYFDAVDLKANICMAQGDHEEAQRMLDSVSRKTPRNYLRKRLLAAAATLNGDTATARAAMADVLANDSMGGAITPADHLALARSQVEADDLVGAEKSLLALRESDVQNLTLNDQASHAALLSIVLPQKGKPRFAGLRPALGVANLSALARLDVLRAALITEDAELADAQARLLMSGEEARMTFGKVKTLYAANGKDGVFRDLQRQVALAKIQQEVA